MLLLTKTDSYQRTFDFVAHESTLKGQVEEIDWAAVSINEAGQLLDQLEDSLAMKKEALLVLVDSNLDQYMMLDKQFKVISRFKNVPTIQSLVLDVLKCIIWLIFGILLGFLLMKLYYKNDNSKGSDHGIRSD